MKHPIAYMLLIITTLVISFGFSIINDDGMIHLKVIKEEHGEKSIFEKIYENMEALKSDKELMEFDALLKDWTSDYENEIYVKKRIDLDKDFTWISDDEEVIEVKGKKVIKIKTDGDEKVFTVTSDGDGEHTMVWIDEDGSKIELTEKNTEKMALDGGSVEAHKKIEVINSNGDEENKNIIITKDDDSDTEIEVKIEKEIDANGKEVIKEKRVWVTEDGKKVELDNENSFEFITEGDNITIKVDDKTIDIANLSDTKFEGENVMVFKTKSDGEEGVKQTMNVNVEEKDGEKFIEIDIKRNAELNVTISEILQNDASLQDAKIDLKNNLKPSHLGYYPNPNNGKFNLRFSLDQEEEVTVKVMDILGNEVYKEKLLDFRGIYDNEINLEGKEKGIYILQISQKNKALTRKILIE